MLRGGSPDLGRHLLLHHGVPFTLVELRLLGGRPAPRPGACRSPRPKMFRSSDACRPSAIDDLYSELALVAW